MLNGINGCKKVAYLLVLTAILLAAADQSRMVTSQHDNMRTGANVSEQILKPANVNVSQFGKVFSYPVDGAVFAQPLYLPNVDVPGRGVHNVVFIATEHDSVYAFDADRAQSTPLWHVNLLPPGDRVTTVSDSDVRCPFISPEVGITSTPVIDLETGTLYVLARAKRRREGTGAEYTQKLHALAITTGVEKFGGPVEISASVEGDGVDSYKGQLKFDPLRENPRAALLLVKGHVYLTWASSCDVGPYHGWVMTYDAHTLKQEAVMSTSPDSAESGIWMSDTGPAADEQGNVYVVTGNGAFDANNGKGRDYGDSALRLSLKGGQLLVGSYFTPYNYKDLSSDDNDLGSGGPVLLPGKGHPAGIVFGGKAGDLFVVDPTRMGGLQGTLENASLQRIRVSSGIYSAPAYWNGHLYYYGAGDTLKDFIVTNGRLAVTPAAQSSRKSETSGGTPTVSANGDKDGVVWIIENKAWNAYRGKAVLHAYDALNVSKELYSSDQNPDRDRAGDSIRFTIPMVANGRVYVGVKNAVTVYGLLPH